MPYGYSGTDAVTAILGGALQQFLANKTAEREYAMKMGLLKQQQAGILATEQAQQAGQTEREREQQRGLTEREMEQQRGLTERDAAMISAREDSERRNANMKLLEAAMESIAQSDADVADILPLIQELYQDESTQKLILNSLTAQQNINKKNREMEARLNESLIAQRARSDRPDAPKVEIPKTGEELTLNRTKLAAAIDKNPNVVALMEKFGINSTQVAERMQASPQESDTEAAINVAAEAWGNLIGKTVGYDPSRSIGLNIVNLNAALSRRGYPMLPEGDWSIYDTVRMLIASGAIEANDVDGYTEINRLIAAFREVMTRKSKPKAPERAPEPMMGYSPFGSASGR
jgi:recombination DNA repair RAD52 pathway protein